LATGTVNLHRTTSFLTNQGFPAANGSPNPSPDRASVLSRCVWR